MSELRIAREDGAGDDYVLVDHRGGGKVFLCVGTEFGEQFVFLTLQQAKRLALAIETEAQAGHVDGCEACQAATGDHT